MKFKRQQLEDKMGLDMYLNAKRFLWNSEDELVKKLSDNFPELGDIKIKEVSAEAAYWRKANAIHKWFVDNVQDGTDDCGYYDVDKEKLQELIDVIDQVLADKSKADTLLPTQGGFFFGDTKYDQYYFEDLEYTKTMLTGLLDDKWKGWWFEYHSSW
jgi:hypothetical protein